jgi:tRNA nucleotidyltransferase (CCA-adding enzyme)
MRIILTHEQADFDAIASLLGAYLLNDSAIPIVPRRVNRNVRAFMNLYGAELPFIEHQDLPGELVDAITLVDAQTMVSVKGTSSKTRIHVIDHHPLRDDIPPDWQITVASTGANTTIFVETIRDKEIVLSTVHATLLLLGIYEDTGSLTYITTTSKDLKAASYLLEQGASLSIAADFLNHPLSSDQQKVYDRLRNNFDSIKIYGHRVIIASADASDMEEELSTVAHKLKDLLDPEGLFVLLKTRSGVQMITRSTSDDIDVGRIAVYFGGGGHERAAASLIKDKLVDEVRQELLELLPEYIRPTITVTQIMSREPHLLSPDTSVQEASKNMQRYGYEGYPVVKNGKVVGLLTRRSVDRAITHKLNLTASSLMEAGAFHVHPDDSIEALQRLMTETGWGQVPVLEPESGEILGIVTRTDVLKTLTEKTGIPSRQNLADKLDKSLPAGRLVLLKAIAQIANEHENALYIVGGFVRDLLLDRPSEDFDLVVEGDAVMLARMLVQRYGGRLTSHTRFGTAKWLLNPESKNLLSKEMNNLNKINISVDSSLDDGKFPDTVDLVTARTEFYTHPTALPTIERSSIKLDLHRRDFTINTLALRLDGKHYGELYDHWGGLSDLRHGVLKVLHSLSFVDDPTRILRAVRFEQRFDFKIEKRTLELMGEAANLLERVSGDRIRHELDYIFTEPRQIQMLERLSELKLLKAIHKDLTWDDWLEEKISILINNSPDLEWELMNHVSTRIDLTYLFLLLRQSTISTTSIISRLKLSATQAKLIHSAQSLLADLPALSLQLPSQVVARLNQIPIKTIYALFIAVESDGEKDILKEYVSKWRYIEAGISGHQLREKGIKPGPSYKNILESLKNAWLDGVVSSHEEEDKLLDRLLKDTIETD